MTKEMEQADFFDFKAFVGKKVGILIETVKNWLKIRELKVNKEKTMGVVYKIQFRIRKLYRN